ncbi:Chloramphenicol phosphotransferase-like protein [Streptomyces sp. 2231.1]|nr:Chloramphenicol phosphotransferase-like protein [Streptomyces sp. 2231.1]
MVTGPTSADPADATIPDTPAGGTVVLLNGTSSSGKSSIARALLDVLDGTWFHLPVGAFHAMRCHRPIADEDLQAEIDRAVKGFHRAVAGMAAAGNNLVVDHPLSRRWRLTDLLGLLDRRTRSWSASAARCPNSGGASANAVTGNRDWPHCSTTTSTHPDCTTSTSTPACSPRRNAPCASGTSCRTGPAPPPSNNSGRPC